MKTNLDILHNPRHDHYCVSVRPPQQKGEITEITVLPDDPAILIDPDSTDPYSVNLVREGRHPEIWLLSGGIILVRTDTMELAMGERNSLAADPGLWTHIGAGRADSHILPFSHRELMEEFTLSAIIPPGKEWTPLTLQAESGSNHPTSTSPHSISYTLRSPIELFSRHLTGWKPVLINWPDCTEELDAYMFIDHDNRTIELRLFAAIDLSAYSQTRLEFHEGTGQADWFSLTILQSIRNEEKKDGRNRLTPVMQYLLDDFQSPFSGSEKKYGII